MQTNLELIFAGIVILSITGYIFTTNIKYIYKYVYPLSLSVVCLLTVVVGVALGSYLMYLGAIGQDINTHQEEIQQCQNT